MPPHDVGRSCTGAGYAPSSDAGCGRPLSEAFERAVRDDSADATRALRQAVAEFVAGATLRALPPERVIIALKASLRAGHHSADGWQPSLDVETHAASMRREAMIYRDVFRWCVDELFGAGGP